jgi:glycerophosphoryl diester phosphodiesterase
VTVGPLIIGHRGASGYRPEHTLASYRLAIELGADFIEPDLVATRDHQLVTRHEPEISTTTDVATRSEFTERRTTRLIDGVAWTGWFTDDFTLAELRTLRAVERLPEIRPANTAFDGEEPIPTFQEVIDLARRAGVGLYPETKHPSYFRSVGLPLEEPMVEALAANGYRGPSDPVFIQSFETANLRALRAMTALPLVQLLGAADGQPFDFAGSGDPRTYADLMSPDGLAGIADYAAGIGPDKSSIIPRDISGRSRPATALVGDAHAAGLVVHPWTFRRENAFLPAELRRGDPEAEGFDRATGDLAAELALFFELRVDGVFTDNADVAGVARAAFRARQ